MEELTAILSAIAHNSATGVNHQHHCCICHKAATQICPKCNAVYTCGEQTCNRGAWKTFHSKLCGVVQQLQVWSLELVNTLAVDLTSPDFAVEIRRVFGLCEGNSRDIGGEMLEYIGGDDSESEDSAKRRLKKKRSLKTRELTSEEEAIYLELTNKVSKDPKFYDFDKDGPRDNFADEVERRFARISLKRSKHKKHRHHHRHYHDRHKKKKRKVISEIDVEKEARELAKKIKKQLPSMAQQEAAEEENLIKLARNASLTLLAIEEPEFETQPEAEMLERRRAAFDPQVVKKREKERDELISETERLDTERKKAVLLNDEAKKLKIDRQIDDIVFELTKMGKDVPYPATKQIDDMLKGYKISYENMPIVMMKDQLEDWLTEGDIADATPSSISKLLTESTLTKFITLVPLMEQLHRLHHGWQLLAKELPTRQKTESDIRLSEIRLEKEMRSLVSAHAELKPYEPQITSLDRKNRTWLRIPIEYFRVQEESSELAKPPAMPFWTQQFDEKNLPACQSYIMMLGQDLTLETGVGNIFGSEIEHDLRVDLGKISDVRTMSRAVNLPLSTENAIILTRFEAFVATATMRKLLTGRMRRSAPEVLRVAWKVVLRHFFNKRPSLIHDAAARLFRSRKLKALVTSRIDSLEFTIQAEDADNNKLSNYVYPLLGSALLGIDSKSNVVPVRNIEDANKLGPFFTLFEENTMLADIEYDLVQKNIPGSCLVLAGIEFGSLESGDPIWDILPDFITGEGRRRRRRKITRDDLPSRLVFIHPKVETLRRTLEKLNDEVYGDTVIFVPAESYTLAMHDKIKTAMFAIPCEFYKTAEEFAARHVPEAVSPIDAPTNVDPATVASVTKMIGNYSKDFIDEIAMPAPAPLSPEEPEDEDILSEEERVSIPSDDDMSVESIPSSDERSVMSIPSVDERSVLSIPSVDERSVMSIPSSVETVSVIEMPPPVREPPKMRQIEPTEPTEDGVKKFLLATHIDALKRTTAQFLPLLVGNTLIVYIKFSRSLASIFIDLLSHDPLSGKTSKMGSIGLGTSVKIMHLLSLKRATKSFGIFPVTTKLEETITDVPRLYYYGDMIIKMLTALSSGGKPVLEKWRAIGGVCPVCGRVWNQHNDSEKEICDKNMV